MQFTRGWYKYLTTHSGTGNIQCEVVHGDCSTEVGYIRKFGFRMLYHLLTDLLPTLNPRIHEAKCLRDNGDEVYIVLIVDGIIMTKHIRDMEDQFPGISLINNECDSDT